MASHRWLQNALADDEELGKYDSIEGVNHINYISHIPSKILDGRYVADFLGLLSALSIKVQS